MVDKKNGVIESQNDKAKRWNSSQPTMTTTNRNCGTIKAKNHHVYYRPHWQYKEGSQLVATLTKTVARASN